MKLFKFRFNKHPEESREHLFEIHQKAIRDLDRKIDKQLEHISFINDAKFVANFTKYCAGLAPIVALGLEIFEPHTISAHLISNRDIEIGAGLSVLFVGFTATVVNSVFDKIQKMAETKIDALRKSADLHNDNLSLLIEAVISPYKQKFLPITTLPPTTDIVGSNSDPQSAPKSPSDLPSPSTSNPSPV